MTLALERIDTPTGPMLAVTDEAGSLCALEWIEHEDRMTRWLGKAAWAQVSASPRPGTASLAVGALRAYFDGDLEAIDSVKTAARGTDFQHAVWRALRAIPVGTTVSYGTLAARIGRPTAVRAVGLANGSNPIPIVVPCHRVIGADGSLTGFGGGLNRKRWLLAHEAAAGVARFALG